MGERRDIRAGMRVRDADGRSLGRVTRCSDWGIEFERNFLLMKLEEGTAPWQEVDVADGVVTVARSANDLLTLARGGIPSGWRRVVLPSGATVVATPAEAAGCAVAARDATAVPAVRPGDAPATPPPSRDTVPEHEARNVPGAESDEATRHIAEQGGEDDDGRPPTQAGRTDAGSPAVGHH